MSLYDEERYSHFTFTHRSNGKDVTINLDKQDARVPELLEEFMNFLRACGYCFEIDDYFDVVNDFRHPALNSEEMINDSEPEAEAKAYQQAFGFETPVPNEWVEYDANGKEQHFSSIPGFNYKPEDY